MWTCIECNNNYNKLTGDLEEKTCNDCLDNDEGENKND